MSGKRNKQSSGATGAMSTKSRETRSTKSASVTDPILGGQLKTLRKVIQASIARQQLDASPSSEVSFTWMGLEDGIDGERGTAESPPPHPCETAQRREALPSPWLLRSGDRVEEGPLALTLSSLESHGKVANEGQEAETAISETLPLATNTMEDYGPQALQNEGEPESTDMDRVRRRLALDQEEQEQGEVTEPSVSPSTSSGEPFRGSLSKERQYTHQRPHFVHGGSSVEDKAMFREEEVEARVKAREENIMKQFQKQLRQERMMMMKEMKEMQDLLRTSIQGTEKKNPVRDIKLPTPVKKHKEKEDKKEFNYNKVDQLNIPIYSVGKSATMPFEEWYKEHFETEINVRNIQHENLVIMLLRKHVEPALWKNLIIGVDADTIATDLSWWLQTLNKTYNVLPDELGFRDQLKTVKQEPSETVRVYEGRLREVYRKAYRGKKLQDFNTDPEYMLPTWTTEDFRDWNPPEGPIRVHESHHAYRDHG